MKYSGNIYLKIILRVTKNQGFTLSLEEKFFEKPQGGVKLTPSAVLGLSHQQLRNREVASVYSLPYLMQNTKVELEVLLKNTVSNYFFQLLYSRITGNI